MPARILPFGPGQTCRPLLGGPAPVSVTHPGAVVQAEPNRYVPERKDPEGALDLVLNRTRGLRSAASGPPDAPRARRPVCPGRAVFLDCPDPLCYNTVVLPPTGAAGNRDAGP